MLFAVGLDGATEQLTRAGDGTAAYHLRPSRDGAWLVYGTRRQGVRQLSVMRLADRAEKQITDLQPGHAVIWPHWQPTATSSR